MTTERSVAIKANVESVERRIVAACQRVGRDRGDVTVVAVSKRFPIEDIARAYDAGVRDFGENRVQELLEKMTEWERSFPDRPVTWHMVGHLQRNKVGAVVGRVPIFHGLDSMRLADAINRVALSGGITYPCLLQVNVSGEESKFGFSGHEVDAALEGLRSYEGISIKGLMTLARPADDPEDVRADLAKLRSLFERSQAVYDHSLAVLSMGMSGDFEVAIEEGSTHVRLGTSIFGDRPA
ncbi:MAG: YggS family pyridoxal phosphate-dependent enzyme [Rhodothermales bacterium]|nr:YggS family pyridoxal phosphate-dependent enzyme [Rhodothermales bacterium]